MNEFRSKFAAISAALVFGLLPGVALAIEKPESKDRPCDLMVGDPAPALHLGRFVKGNAFQELQKGKVYVIDYWATWCPECVEGMPLLTALQKKYGEKGLVILGVTKPDPENTLEIVSKLVTKKGDEAGYAIAMDDGRATFDGWMKAAGQRYIPCAFIVNRDGKIAHILQPDQEDLEGPLVKILAGDWDIAANRARFIEKIQRRARSDALNEELNAAKKANDWKKAIGLCDELLTLDPKDNVDIVAEKFRIQLVDLKDYSEAYAFGRQAATTLAHDDARTLNRIAFPIVDPKLKIANPDLELALDAAQRANELKKGEGPYVLNTLARIRFVKGEVKEAIALQKKALSLADPESKAEFQSTLEEYEHASHE